VKPLRFHEAARREANQAALWHAARSIRLAQDFLKELKSAYARALKSRHLYPLYLHGTRRVLLERFPYFIVYLDLQDAVYIVAVAHAKRRPGYWSKRI